MDIKDIKTPEDFKNLPKEDQDRFVKVYKEIQEAQARIAKEDKGVPQLTMDELKGMISETAKKLIEPMTKVDRKFFMFPGIGKDGADDLSPEGKFAKTIKFVKALAGGDVYMLRALHMQNIEEAKAKANLSEGTDTAGGFLVPEEFKAEILRLAPLYGVIRANSRIVPMTRDVQNWPAAGTTDQSAVWTNEAAQILQTNPNFRQIVLTINKLAALPKVTSELLEDANVDTIGYLSEVIAEAFAKEEDNQGFNGTGSPFVGVLSATGVPTTPHDGGTGFICLSYADLVEASGAIYDTVQGNAKWYFHRTVIAHIRGLVTTTGAPLFPPTARDLFGYPVISAEKLPGIGSSGAVKDTTPYAVFGDLRRGCMFGERGSIRLKLTDQATVDSDNLFEKDMMALRAIERITFGVALPSSFTRILS